MAKMQKLKTPNHKTQKPNVMTFVFLNQHVPHYCGSCWAQGTASALADRFIIADRKKYANAALSPQAIINCRAGGSCQGGNPAAVYEFAQEVGVRFSFSTLLSDLDIV